MIMMIVMTMMIMMMIMLIRMTMIVMMVKMMMGSHFPLMLQSWYHGRSDVESESQYMA